MKSVLTGIVLMLVVSLISWVVMSTQAVTSHDAYVSHNGSVRLDN